MPILTLPKKPTSGDAVLFRKGPAPRPETSGRELPHQIPNPLSSLHFCAARGACSVVLKPALDAVRVKAVLARQLHDLVRRLVFTLADMAPFLVDEPPVHWFHAERSHLAVRDTALHNVVVEHLQRLVFVKVVVPSPY